MKMYSYLRKFVATNPYALKRTLSGIGPKYYEPGGFRCAWWGSAMASGGIVMYIYCKDDSPPPPPLFNFI